MRKVITYVQAVVFVILVGSYSSPHAAAKEFEVLLDGISFIYDGKENEDIDLVINVGDTVRWRWVSGLHNVVSGFPGDDHHDEGEDGHVDDEAGHHEDAENDGHVNGADGHDDDMHVDDAHMDDDHMHVVDDHADLFVSGEPTDVIGTIFEYTFTEAGVFSYHCHPHEAVGMISTVTVIPEPSSIFLIAVGTIWGIHARRLRRRK